MSSSSRIIFTRSGDRTNILNSKDIKYVSLMHPKGAKTVCLMIDDEIYEVQNCQPRRHGSWFINQRVISSSNFYLASKIDMRFYLLPHLQKATKFSPLDQIVVNHPGCFNIPVVKANDWNMSEFCDINDKFDDMLLYRYNELKTMNWLAAKVNRCSIVLLNKRKKRYLTNKFVETFHVTAQRSDAGNSATEEQHPNKDDLKEALQIVMEYLTDEMGKKLVAHLNMTDAFSAAVEEEESKNAPDKRKADWELELEIEKETLAYAAEGAKAKVEAPLSSTKVAKTVPTTSAVANSKHSKGTKNIMSFFGAKK